MKLLVGADPELFVTREGKSVSAHGLVNGTKYAPEPVTLGAVQVDGMALEFNISPAHNEDQFIYHIETVMQELRKKIPADYQFKIDPVAFFDPEHMASQPPEARELGCDPDFNAYTLEANPRPNAHPTMRSAAGHMHGGWTQDADPFEEEHFNYCAEFVKQLDYTNGLLCTIYDEDEKRKQLYGMAGAFRPKHYGVEWRVASNFWIKDKKLMRLMYNNFQLAFSKMADGVFLHEEYGEDTARNIINTNDRKAALALCEKAGIPVSL